MAPLYKQLLLAIVIYFSPSKTDAQTCYATGYQQAATASLQSYAAVQTYQTYYSYSCGWWGWRRCSGSNTRYRTVTAYRYVTAYKQISTQLSQCCSGYSGTHPNCNPICSGGCGNGQCTAPSTCSCNSGWSGSTCTNPVCSAGCGNGYCSAPGTCSCNSGWSGSTCSNPICSGGCGNGYCSSPGTCSCNSGWSGSTCSTPICNGGCGNGHCSSPGTCSCNNGWGGGTCLTPLCNSCVHGTCTAPFTCSCSSGWTGGDCNTDINECGSNNGGCASTCHNTAGSYYCSCPSGCTLNSNGHACNDINECAGTNNCAHNCHNTGSCGGYYCSCNTGYSLNGNGYSCDNINECANSNGGCAQNCHDTAGSYYCSCNAGYSLASNGHGCNDINECNTNNGGCNQVCTNTIGSFECSCNTGYELSANPLICVDTNECANNNGGCAQNCHNTVGSYYCTCNTGYTLSSNGHACLDNDECALNTHLCHHVCINTIGSYICDCNVGYMLNSDGLTCSDIDECATNNGGCDQNCHNTVGSYYCTCNIGFLLDEDSHGCSDHNECATGHDNCDQNCHNSHGSFSCSCNSTWRLDANGYTCNDIDECAEDSSGCTQICNNTPGSYYCTCFVGFSLDGDKHTCNDINECNTNNGGCFHNCHNTIGSYYCTCDIGFLLDNDYHNCSDIDECATDNGGCDQDCHNTYGSYYCTCGSGWRLDPDGHTCNDTDECAEDSSGCTQICNNTPGSYYCTCLIGYSLDNDNHTCNDINECSTANGGCAHWCTNNIGSYVCSCRAGYDLNDDDHYCDAQPCVPQLTAPQNGSMWCTGDQVTDQNCSFACDAGFTFGGSELRECLSSNSWTGVDVTCTPKHCISLTDPPNGFVDIVIDCDTVLTTACEIKCVDGYYINDTTPFYQTCVANQTSGGVYWTTRPVCQLIPPCDPNPCKHSGACTEVGTTEYTCDCTGTQYKGKNCEIGLITFPRVSILTVNETSSMLYITALPDDFINITFMASSQLTFNPPSVTITSNHRSVGFTISPRESGMFILTYSLSGLNAAEYDEPRSYYILVLESSTTHPPNKYFSEVGLDYGMLAPGCCTTGSASYQCPAIATTISFSSSCSWSLGDGGAHLSDGVVFTTGAGLQLPISIAGTELSPDLAHNVLPTDQLTCPDCGGTDQHCYHYDFVTNDVVDLLRSLALSRTYLENSQDLVPSWLTLSLGNETLPLDTPFASSDYSTTLSLGDQVTEVQGCETLEVDRNGFYSILRFSNNLTLTTSSSSDEEDAEYTPADNDAPICFAVDLCRGSSSPVYITIPAGSHDTLTSFTQLNQYTSRGWQFTFTDAAVSRTGLSLPFTVPDSYWNGVSSIDPTVSVFDLRVTTTIRNRLTSNDLWIDFDFIGDLYHQANPTGIQVEGVLAGDIALSANMTINGEAASFRMVTRNQLPAVFSMPDYATVDLPGGASFKLQYTTDAKLLTDLLPVPEDMQDCPTDAFIRFIDTTRDLSWMSFMQQCSGLTVSQFMFPAGSLVNHVYLTGSSDPPTPDSNWDGATIKVYTSLTSSSLQLNQYLSILQPSSGPTLSAGYWRGGKQEGRIYQAAFSLLGTYFTAPANLYSGSLGFAANADLFGEYRSDITGVIPASDSWADTPVSVSGEFETGPSSFIASLQNYTYNHVMNKIAMAEERIHNAEVAKNTTQQQLTDISAQYNSLLTAKQAAENVYQEALARQAVTAAAVQTAQANVDEVNTIVLQAQSRIDDICEVADCQPQCVPGLACQSCANEIPFELWGYCERATTEQRLMYRTVTKTEEVCEYEQQCRLVTKVREWGLTSFGQTCSYVCTPTLYTTEVEETYYTPVQVSHTYPCPTATNSLSIDQVCCNTNYCSQSIQDIECIYYNDLCERAREPAYNALNETEQLLIAPLRELTRANTNHSIAVALVAAADANRNLTDQELQIVQPIYLSLQQAVIMAESNYQMVLNDEQPTINIRNFLLSHSIEDLIEVENIRFSVTFQEESPSIIPLDIHVRVQQLNKTVNLTVSQDMTAPSQLVKRDLSDRILSHVGKELSPPAMRRRRSVEEAPLNVQRFETNCASIADLKQYLVGINNTLDNMAAHIEMSRQNVTNTISLIKALIDFTLFNESSVNYTLLVEQFEYNMTESDLSELVQNSSSINQIVQVVNSIVTAADALLSSLDSSSNVFVSWQLAMGTVTTVSDTNCFGFVDCLIATASRTQQLLQDMPGAMATRLLAELPAARQTLTELALATTFSLEEAKSKTAPMVAIISDIEAIGYWCSRPPVIAEQPEKDAYVNVGQQLSLSCRANSSLPVAYSWKKNKFVLPSYTTNYLTRYSAQVSDEGVYQCLATNSIITTTSLFSTVAVFDPPVITLSPSDYTTFEGDDNGAVFVCNATARPSPNYQWHWSPNGEMWSDVVNGTANELFISKPPMESEGWYRCRAYTDNAWVQSGNARLTILPVMISKLVYPVSFQLELVDTIATSGSGSGSDIPDTTELIKQALHKMITDGLHLTTSQISNITILVISDDVVLVTTTLLTEYNLPLNETLADIALPAHVHLDNILLDVMSLQHLLHNTSLRLTAGPHIYRIDNETVAISDLEYVCPRGYILQYNNFLCIGCAPGQYQDIVDNEWVCRDCGIGNYQTEDASTSCQLCPSRHTTISNVSRSIGDCLAHCQPGHFNSSYGVEPCLPCPKWRYQLKHGATSCIPCPERSTVPACVRPIISTPQIPTTRGYVSPSPTRTVGEAGINLPVLIGGVATGIVCGGILLLSILLIVGVIYRTRKNRSSGKHEPLETLMYNRSSISGDPNSIFSNTRNFVPTSGAIPNPYNLTEASKQIQDGDIWRANPLYMDMEEIEKDWDEDYEPSNQHDYTSTGQDDDPVDTPVDFSDYDYDNDQRGLIQ